ncbi:MAG: type II secretion system F family protein, partial [Geminicoccaceae bacterium]
DNRAMIDGLLLNIPLIGDLVIKAETARFARTVGMLLVNGVTLPASLAITKETIKNTVLRSMVGETLDAVKQGKGLAATLERSNALPKIATQMIAVGEQSGQLDKMLLKTSSIFDQEVKTTVERLMTLLVPALTIGVGLIVAMIIGAILSAILATYQLPV